MNDPRDRVISRELAAGRPSPKAVNEGARPITESLKRRAVRLTPPQSDALARLLSEGRRVRELFTLTNGTLGATFTGGGYAALRVFVTTDGRVQEDEEASAPDLDRASEGALVIARDDERLYLGTLLPPEARRKT